MPRKPKATRNKESRAIPTGQEVQGRQVTSNKIKRKKKVLVEEKMQELRDAVERLPDIPLPGAPTELPKDLPDPNPVREPAVIPAQNFYSASVKTAKTPKVDLRKNIRKKIVEEPSERAVKIKVWLAVTVTFLVVAGAWVTTLKFTLSSPVGSPTLGAELGEIKAEWDSAAENIKLILAEMNSRIKSVNKDNSTDQEKVLQAVGARVIFEASRATSTE